MCISSAALAALLTLVGAEHVTLGDDRVIVHAQAQDAHWVANDENLWCTMAPQIDRMHRFKGVVAQ